MSIQIFHFEGSMGGDETFLELVRHRPLGDPTYTVSPNYHAALRGAKGGVTTLSVELGKTRWPSFATDIDSAVARLRSQRPN